MGEEGRERCAPVSEGRTQLVRRLRPSGLSSQPKRKLLVEKKPARGGWRGKCGALFSLILSFLNKFKSVLCVREPYLPHAVQGLGGCR